MYITKTRIEDVLVIEPEVHRDHRGSYYESFNQRDCGTDAIFVQDNHSSNVGIVMRGLHYQIKQPQAKLIRVIKGEIFDVAVDLRESSPTFGQYVSATLSAENRKQLFIPRGFAHGFMTISHDTEILYKTDEYWAPEHERTIRWDDPDIDIVWPLTNPTMSIKDENAASFLDAVYHDDVYYDNFM